MTTSKDLQKKEVVLKTTTLENKFYIDKYADRFDLVGEFKTLEEANKCRQEISEAGFISSIRSFSPNKHDRPHTIWKGRKKKNFSKSQKDRYLELDDQGKAIKHGQYGRKPTKATLKKKSNSMKKRKF